MNRSLISAISFIIGILLGVFVFKQPEPLPKNPIVNKVEYKNICNKEVDLISKCPVVNNDELYSKVFILFLASVGIEMNNEIEQEVSKLVKSPKEYKPNESLKVKVVSTTEDNPQSTEFIYNKGSNTDAPYRDFKDLFPDKVNSNMDIFEATNRILKDPENYISKSKYINKFREIERYNGVYTGELFITKGGKRGEISLVEMRFQFELQNENNINGNMSVTLAKDGVVYSNNSGKGGNKSLKVSPNKRDIIIEVSPDAYFHFPRGKIRNGNFYENAKHVGYVIVEKN